MSSFLLRFAWLVLAIRTSTIYAFQVLPGTPHNGYECHERLSSTTKLWSAGPKATGRRRRPARTSNNSSTNAGPKQTSSRRSQSVKESYLPFDGKQLTGEQVPNEQAPPFELSSAIDSGELKCMTEGMLWGGTAPAISVHPPFEFLSLEDLFGKQFATLFHENGEFRAAMRSSIRQDIFNATPFYASLSEKAASIILLPDSSLEGSWRNPPNIESGSIRMKELTRVLSDFEICVQDNNGKGKIALNGDDIMHRIGALCGSKPSTHWIDIHGVQDRKVSHSWHQDFGQSPEGSMTVLWGFPKEDNFVGCGVFSHVVSLTNECGAPETHPPNMEPVLFQGKIDEQFIVRPCFGPGRELLRYRDIDVLHSAPDVTYRASVMRFM